MTFLTDFADQAVILPLVLVVAVVLAAQGWRRGAVAWLVVIAATLGAVLVLKLIFIGCSALFGTVGLRSPSGHVAAAAVVAGGIVTIVSRNRALVVPIVVATAIMIGLTRIGLQAHSLPEAILGGCVGLAGALALAHFAGPPPRLRLRPLLVVATFVLVGLHGQHLQAEVLIHHAATHAGLFPAWCRDGVQARP